MTRRLAFTVLGEPQPQGSKTIVQRKGKRPVVRDDNPDTRPWRERVERAALEAMAGDELATGPLELTVTFVFRRPAGHYGTGRNAGVLKPSAPLYVRTRPDADKLLRAVGDAIAGTICRDDAQVVIAHAEKHYGEHACAHVTVDELTLDDDRPPPDPLKLDPTHQGAAMSEVETTEQPTTPQPDPLPGQTELEPQPDEQTDDDQVDDGTEQ